MGDNQNWLDIGINDDKPMDGMRYTADSTQLRRLPPSNNTSVSKPVEGILPASSLGHEFFF